MGRSDFNNLGQYFTPEKVAFFMDTYLEKNTPPGGLILDPCIGKNVFFKNLDSKRYKLTGVEIDPTLIDKDVLDFFQSNKKLIIGDFLKTEFDNKFDSIVVNPPYVRQEKISIETKKLLKNISILSQIEVSQKANLYIFFILKSLLLLKQDGMLIAITYDSWLYSSFGKKFKEHLINNYSLQEIIHFKNNAFVGVDIGATIIIIKNNKEKVKIKYIEFESPEYLVNKICEKDFHVLSPLELVEFNEHTTDAKKLPLPNEIFQPISLYSSKIPWRGVSSPSNKYFIYNTPNNFLRPVVKYGLSKDYSLSSSGLVYGLFTQENTKAPDFYRKIKKLKEQILEENISLTLIKNVMNNCDWYLYPYKKGGNIIFNYYFRDNLKFIFNPDEVSTMGNFYNLYIIENLYPTIALLNSTLTRYAFLRFSKNQGRGLKKIQLSKFKEVPIFKLSNLTSNEIQKLAVLGKELLKSADDHKKTLDKIDLIILNRYSKLTGIELRDINFLINDKIKRYE